MMHLFSKNSSLLSLKKSTHILRHTFQLFKRKKKRLIPEIHQHIETCLRALQEAILEKDRQKADLLAKEVSALAALHLKKTFSDIFREVSVAIGFALCIAVLVRQMWFEPYEIPTGSMRPTFKEKDRLIVTKTDFGINLPLKAAHLYFDPDLVKRNAIVVFTGENMDIRDVDTLYFYIFPGKKQYIKRLIGKPGDILYFYGGKIYGFDKDGKDISAQLQQERVASIEHIPFIDFDRKIVAPPAPTQGIYSPIYFYQMNEPIAKMSVNKAGYILGEMLTPPSIRAPGTTPLKDYFDLWGMSHFGMTRLLTKEQVKQFTSFDLSKLPDGLLYLEITHHPSFAHARLIRDEMGRVRPSLSKSTSLLPLQQEHLQALFKAMYTARFCVKGGFAFRYGSNPEVTLRTNFSVPLPGVPDGCYEFYYGVASEIKWEGISQKLPDEHPLYRFSPELLQLLYNVGIEWDMRFMPQFKDQRLVPSRYTYFRDGDLCLLGTPILKKQDPTLVEFISREYEKKAAVLPPYFPFVDTGAPLLADGTLDKERILQYGLMIPEKSYLVLGDNHAMSSDSRDFGFVPQNNLRGSPDFIFWPPGPRWGIPNQPTYPFFTLPRMLIWVIAGLCIVFSISYWNRRNRLPLNI